MKSSEIKSKAKELLSGKRMNAALVSFLFITISLVANLIMSSLLPGEKTEIDILGQKIPQTIDHPVTALVVAFVSVFLALGMNSYFMKIARGEDPEITELFSKGNILLKAVVSGLIAGVLILLGTCALIVPGVILIFAFSMINYIYIDNPSVGIIEVLSKSRKMMKGHKWQYFCLEFSFIGWILLTGLTLGILSLWVIPYMGVASLVFYEEIKDAE